MRLTALEKDAIKTAVLSIDTDAKVYLFGSRTDDRAKGGDIDLLIFSSRLNLKDKLKIKSRIYDKIGEQKIDILIEKEADKPFVKLTMEKAVLL